MDAQDRIAWQPFLTPRQTRIIRDALVVYEPQDAELPHYDKLFEWFDRETELHANRAE